MPATQSGQAEGERHGKTRRRQVDDALGEGRDGGIGMEEDVTAERQLEAGVGEEARGGRQREVEEADPEGERRHAPPCEYRQSHERAVDQHGEHHVAADEVLVRDAQRIRPGDHAHVLAETPERERQACTRARGRCGLGELWQARDRCRRQRRVTER